MGSAVEAPAAQERLEVLVLDVYPAREGPIPGVTSELIIEVARVAGADVTPVHDKVRSLPPLREWRSPVISDVLLQGGQVALESLLPGFLAQLREAGAPAWACRRTWCLWQSGR
ncbi:hypothetical protein SUDANB58_04501 [Streptomyces sp. enrichment culture]